MQGQFNTASDHWDLKGISVNAAIGSSNVVGTTFLVDQAAHALEIVGGTGDDTIDASSITLTQAERDFIFANGSIETIIDQSGTYNYDLL